jgi:glycosyltransferase involved in cell wall biosynthesis
MELSEPKMATFSIVLPTYMGEYKTAAKSREKKLVRAINSVLSQGYPHWELLITADGCKKSVSIIKEMNIDDERVRVFLIERDGLWAGKPRNNGIQNAKGDYIIYLDADDEYQSDYLERLAEEIVESDKDWYAVDDLIYTDKDGYVRRVVDINRRGACGTSNIIHKPKLNVFWPVKGGYAHDFTFINSLKAASNNHKKLNSCGYIVQHIPGLYDK